LRFARLLTKAILSAAGDQTGCSSVSGSKVSQVETAAAPYSFTWSDVPAGNHLLTAKAIDTFGRMTTSSPVSFTVVGPFSGAVNVARTTNGRTASASSTYNTKFSVNGAIDGDRNGNNWGNGGGWNDATADLYPDWLQVDFNTQRR
jgi:hypothetical protein